MIDDNGSLKLFDFLFMPYEFAHKLIKYFQLVIESRMNKNESASLLIKNLLDEIVECKLKIIKNNYQDFLGWYFN